MNAVALACWLCAALLPMGATSVTSDDAHARDLRLAIDIHKDHFALYEPVIVTYSVENPLSRPIRAIVSMDYEWHAIGFTIENPKGLAVKYHSGSIADGVLVDQLHPPGVIGIDRTEILWNDETGNWAFPEPGKYVLHARMFVGNYPGPVYIDATPRTIEVTPVTGRNAEAIAYFESKDAFLSLIRVGAAGYCRGKSGPSCFEEIATFVRQYSESNYAPMITWSLAEGALSRRVSVTPEVDLGVQLLREFIAKWSHHPYAPNVLYRLASVLGDAGRQEESAAIMDRLEKEHPAERWLLKELRDQASERGGSDGRR